LSFTADYFNKTTDWRYFIDRKAYLQFQLVLFNEPS
jgi:hypothetical protein